MLLQSALIGKAHKVYSALSVEQSSYYSLVKSEILRAYELIPDLIVRSFEILNVQIIKLMWSLHGKKSFFQKVVCSQQVRNTFDKLKQLVLLKEFKKSVPTSINVPGRAKC